MSQQDSQQVHKHARMTMGSEIVPRRPRQASLSTRLRLVRPHANQQVAPTPPAQTPVRTVSLPAPPDILHREFQPTEYADKHSEKQGRSLYQKLQLPLVVLLGITAGILVQSPQVGQLLIVGYGIIAFIFRIESRNTFTLGILSLATTVLMVGMQHNSLLGQAFAGYTLLLFIVGIVCAAREVREQRTLTTKKHIAGRRY